MLGRALLEPESWDCVCVLLCMEDPGGADDTTERRLITLAPLRMRSCEFSRLTAEMKDRLSKRTPTKPKSTWAI